MKGLISIALVFLVLQLEAQSRHEIESLIDLVAVEVDSSQSIVQNVEIPM